jgi:ATP-dependent Lon protease
MDKFEGVGAQSLPEMVPVIPTMDVVVFPHMIVPLLVVDERIIKGINTALNDSKLILLLATKRKNTDQEAIGTKDLYEIGTLANIMRLVNMPDGSVKILVQGATKVQVTDLSTQDEMLLAKIEHIPLSNDLEEELEYRIKNIRDCAERLASSGSLVSPDFYHILAKMTDPDKIADFVMSHLSINVVEAQKLLEASSHSELLMGVYHLLNKELEVGEVQEKIKQDTRDAMNQSQKEFYLREQLKAIKKELGDDDAEDFYRMQERINALPMNDETREEVNRQVSRLEKMSPDSMEATVTRNYIDLVLSLPWGKETKDNLDILHAKSILDRDHHGLHDIKERILDFISIRNLKEGSCAPILCFSGPPGTGKTSLGKSIAECLGRNYFRISLGGVKDEAEIRGHRRTYVGAMPGRFIQGIRKAGTNNPVIVIDELDKMGSEFRGDPSAAMLEVLDPQQNTTFYDNYLGVPYDLSKVIFIATANDIEAISGPLRDRMEIIHLSGYTQEEKLSIARTHLVDRALADTGLADKKVLFEDQTLSHLISFYTREPGVRELDRMIRKLCSKAARTYVEEQYIPQFTHDILDKFLGPKRYAEDLAHRQNQIGICNGLAWTPYGGEMIKIEAVLMPGKGNLILTGKLGDVMKESAQAALSYARAHAQDFNINHVVFNTHDIHIHVPAGAVPKDGPSAGITMLSAILSVLTHRPINASYAMTGELNLQGHVMPIGGVKEKVLAAKRNGVEHVILPERNKYDLSENDSKLIAQDINLIWVNNAYDVLNMVLGETDQLQRKSYMESAAHT